jgi:epoxyqueuosine reductase
LAERNVIKKAWAIWKGSIKEGGGTISTETGVLDEAPFGFKSRFENGKGTNPEELIGAAGTGACRVYVDAGPLPERDLARRAGLGWIGKNTMLIHPQLGSFTFIGIVLTDLALARDNPFESDRCGTCRRCLDACPTGAFPAARVLDANHCISYLTIETRSSIPDALKSGVGRWLFGCDVCQDVCPWNVRFAVDSAEPRYQQRPADQWPTLEEIVQMTERAYDEAFEGTALERAGRAGLARNAAVVLGNAR